MKFKNPIARSLKDTILFEDFVIDEKPVEVHRQEQTRQHSAAAQAVEEIVPASAEDFLSLIGRLLVDHEELIEQNLQLERTRPKGNELEGLVKKILTVFDSFDRILYIGREFPQDNEVIVNWLKSFESLYFRIKSIFEHYGLIEIKAIGKSVDLDFHEVVEVRPSTEHPEDTVIMERQKGYIFQGRILRVAQVVVAQQP